MLVDIVEVAEAAPQGGAQPHGRNVQADEGHPGEDARRPVGPGGQVRVEPGERINDERHEDQGEHDVVVRPADG